MKYTSSAPARQPVPDLPADDLPMQAPGEKQSKDGASSILFLARLWQERRLLARTMLYGLIASAVLAFLIPARFESTARLMPPDNNQSGGLAMAAAALSSSVGSFGGMASELLGMRSSSDTFVNILASRTVEDKLIEQFNLKRLYGDSRMEDARKDLAEHTRMSIDLKSQVITIGVMDRDPYRAAAIGQAYIEQLDRLVAELSTSSARRERIFLEDRLQSVDRDLESAEKEFSQYSSRNGAIDIKEQGRAMVEAAATLQGQLIAAQSELEGLRQIYTDNNVSVRSVQARIGELKSQLERIGGKGEGTTALSGQEPDSLYPSLRKLPLLGVTYADLYRRTRVQEAVFETLTKEYELAKVQEAKEIPVVKILDPPNIPDKKSFPPRLTIIFLGTVFAFAVAVTWSLSKAAWEESDANDPRKALAQEVLATVKSDLPKFSQNGAGAKLNGLWRFWERSKKNPGKRSTALK